METELGKDKLKIAINPYDIFGYFLPGVVLIFAILSFEFWINYQIGLTHSNPLIHIPAYTAMSTIANKVLSKNDWVFSASFFGILLMFIYVCGHIISSVSSFFIDRGLVSKGYAYPYQILLELDEPKKHWESRSYYKGLFFWVNVYLLIRYWTTLSPSAILGTILYYLGYFIIVITALKILLSAYLSKVPQSLKTKIPPFIHNQSYYFFLVLLKYLFAGFYDFVTLLISRFINTRQSFDEDFRKHFFKLYEEQFSLSSQSSESNNYWLPVCYIADKSPILNSMIVNWLHMYSYARNIATAFYLAFLYCFISLFIQPNILTINQAFVVEYLPVIFFGLSLIMLQRYYYLYFSYYSKFIYRAFHYLKLKDAR